MASLIIKQGATNQLHIPTNINLNTYGYLTFGFYQGGKCIAKYSTADKEFVKIDAIGDVYIYMLASVSKRFGPQRVSFEVTAWNDTYSELLVSETMTVEVCPSEERTSIVDTDDSEINDERIKAYIERIASKYIPKTVYDEIAVIKERLDALEEEESEDE